LKLNVPIVVVDELTDRMIFSNAMLDLASGEIHSLEYKKYDLALNGAPCDLQDYEFTCGKLSNDGKEVEFCVQVDKASKLYSVTPDELLEIKKRAATLFR
jgi:hypothetical protein